MEVVDNIDEGETNERLKMVKYIGIYLTTDELIGFYDHSLLTYPFVFIYG